MTIDFTQVTDDEMLRILQSHEDVLAKPENTIRHMAKEYAGTFYEQLRTDKFRRTFPTVEDFMRGRYHQPDGSVQIDTPCWMHFVDLARKSLTQMLGMPDARISPTMKNAIYDALIEDREKQLRGRAREVHQRNRLGS